MGKGIGKGKLKTGDIISCKSNSWLSRTIRKVTKSEWSHTATVIVGDDILICEAQYKGVESYTYDVWQKKYNYDYIVQRKDMTSSETLEVQNRIIAFLNKKTGYDYVSLLWRYPWYIVTGKWAPNARNSDERVYCSEFVANVSSIRNAYKMSPKDLFDYCEKSDEYKIIK